MPVTHDWLVDELAAGEVVTRRVSPLDLTRVQVTPGDTWLDRIDPRTIYRNDHLHAERHRGDHMPVMPSPSSRCFACGVSGAHFCVGRRRTDLDDFRASLSGDAWFRVTAEGRTHLDPRTIYRNDPMTQAERLASWDESWGQSRG